MNITAEDRLALRDLINTDFEKMKQEFLAEMDAIMTRPPRNPDMPRAVVVHGPNGPVSYSFEREALPSHPTQPDERKADATPSLSVQIATARLAAQDALDRSTHMKMRAVVEGNQLRVSDLVEWDAKLRAIIKTPDDASDVPIVPPPPVFRQAEPTPEHRFPASLDEKLTDYGDPVAEADLTTDDLLTSMRSDAAVTEDVVQKLSRAKRKKFTELLNVELAELQQERGGPKENLKRENEIEALLNLFARVGEM